MATEDVIAAVRRKLNVSWSDPSTDARLADVVGSVSPWLAARLGYPADHAFVPVDGMAWALFLQACLYEWSDALDDFAENYRREVAAARALVTAATQAEGGGQDGAQG